MRADINSLHLLFTHANTVNKNILSVYANADSVYIYITPSPTSSNLMWCGHSNQKIKRNDTHKSLHISIELSFKSIIKFVRSSGSLINLMIDLKMRWVGNAYIYIISYKKKFPCTKYYRGPQHISFGGWKVMYSITQKYQLIFC
jgi:hypothetical protein